MTRAVTLLLALSVTAAFAGREQPRVPSLKVLVLEEGTGLPLANIRLWISTAAEPGREVTTGGDGTATLYDLPPAIYDVHPSSPAHVSRGSERVSVVVGRVESVTLRMVRGGVIAGLVTSADASPVANARVTLIRDMGERVGSHPVIGRSQWTVTTNAGTFEFAGLTAGEYRLAANPVPAVTSAFNDVYYPGTIEVEQSEPVTVALGDRRHITIRLRRVPWARVKGRVIDEETSGRRELTVRRLDVDTGDAISVLLIDIQRDGTFTVDLDAGVHGFTYTVNERFRDPKAAAYTVVHVGEAPVPPLVLTARRVSTMSGRVMYDESKKPALHEVNIYARAIGDFAPVRGDLNPNSHPAEDGVFVIRPLLGRYRFGVHTPDGWLPAAILLDDGRDILHKDFDVEPSRDYANVRIVLTDEVVTLNGSAPPQAKDRYAIAFPIDEATWLEPDITKRAAVMKDGSFVITNLRPWTEYLVAECGWPCWSRHKDLEEYSRKAVRVRVGPPRAYLVTLKR